MHSKRGNNPATVRDKLIGLGEGSIRKSYYPELLSQIEEVKSTRNYLASVLDAIPSAVVGINSELIVTHANNGAAKLTQRDPSELLGLHVSELFPDFALQLNEAASLIEEGTNVTRHRAVVRQPERTSHYDIEVSALRDDSPGAVIIISNVTDKVNFDQMIVQTEKMVSLGGLAAGMAHEINNPLGSILQGAQNIERRLSKDTPANRKAASRIGLELSALEAYTKDRGIQRFLEGIRAAGERAAEIVSHMLNFSRTSEKSHVPTDLAELLNGAISLAENDYDLTRRYDFRNIELVRLFSPVPPVAISPTEIEQVVFNLIKNATHAMVDAEIDTPRLVISLKKQKNEAVITVQDNGPGMDDATRKQAFEPFFTTKRVGIGTGLGLSVSYFIISNNHDGSIDLESSPGNGATFTIRLPIR